METLTRIIPKIIEWAQARTLAGYVHGLHHWNRVADYGQQLCDRIEKEAENDPTIDLPNRKVVLLFAYLHDSCREDDHCDSEHGPRAAEALSEIRHSLLAELTDEEIRLLRKAIRLHTSAERTGNITIDICFDSDRLDLDRVGYVPDPTRMASHVGADFACEHQEWYMKRIMEQEYLFEV